MSSNSSLAQFLRRLKPEKHTKRLFQRDRSTLPFLTERKAPVPKLLLDTTVYIDGLQGKLSREVETVLRTSSLWHSTVTEAELSALAVLLNPAHPDTQQVIAQVVASIEMRPSHRILNPDRETWMQAGVLAGLLARLQGYGKSDQRRALNDALIFLSATKYGCVVLTRNVSDFDLLMQLEASGKALFYEC